ncbi:hypothetical protein VZT92_008526 [Zoarces viviparus]|uniref:Uncharacterized protein n=1 Tax=Zoarces viviparus TaxID=48416 RepID=A0AAW1FFL0_ZOAVI
MDRAMWQTPAGPERVSLYLRCVLGMSDALRGGSAGWFADVFLPESQGRAKAEGWSPSVSLAHSKVAITQD